VNGEIISSQVNFFLLLQDKSGTALETDTQPSTIDLTMFDHAIGRFGRPLGGDDYTGFTFDISETPDPVTLIENLAVTVLEMNLHQGIANSLIAKLNSAPKIRSSLDSDISSFQKVLFSQVSGDR
jgi:hypothetical protein